MITATINNQAVDVEIIEAEFRSGTALDQAELDLIAEIDTRLRNHPDFVKAYPGARLDHVDSNRMLEDTEEGRSTSGIATTAGSRSSGGIPGTWRRST